MQGVPVLPVNQDPNSGVIQSREPCSKDGKARVHTGKAR